MSKSLKESFEILDEIVRKVHSQLNPYDTEKDDIKWVLQKQLRDKLYGEKPECFIPLKSNYGDSVPFFCVCNRLGVQDPNMINHSMKMIDILIKRNKYDPEMLEKIKRKLKNMYGIYNKDIPKPPSSTKYKIQYKKRMNNIKNHLNNIRN